MVNPVIDTGQRAAALDPAQSCIVQAPAGSGKTELLTQRYLRLLALVGQPEEIVAITFTRKAAAEMRSRILYALQGAQPTKPTPESEPIPAHEQVTRNLARSALQRDQQQQWDILLNPHRLRVQTFDSLAASLTRQMPVLSAFGAQPGTVENPQPLYRQAARATLADLSDPAFAMHLAPLLRHLDNRLGQLEELLCGMLQKRDQWLPHVFGAPDIEQLQQALRLQIEQQLQQLDRALPDQLWDEWIRLARYAAQHLDATHALAVWRDTGCRPGTEWRDLAVWQGLANWVLTHAGELRRSVNKSMGFPAPSEKGLDAAAKAVRQQTNEAMLQHLAALRASPEMLSLLAQARSWPVSGYSDQQAELLGHLLQVLLRAAGHLQLVFEQTGEVDFAEIQQRAIQALGGGQGPSDLALILDHRLQHLLVDEFQDTSISQYRLLRLLTHAWQPDDGRSLFMVGDPMQSIYRFREAEVGLYLQTRATGLGDLPLKPLNLQMNFRSQAGVVEWINRTFQALFPTHMDIARGAVSYVPSQAVHTAEATSVQWHAQAGRDDLHEAKQISALIQTLQQQQATSRIAILARSRTHLAAIARQLQNDQIGYQAIEIDALAQRTVVQDLRSLTRALLHPADRLAWLALLRAPWLGLRLADLLLIAEGDIQPVYARLANADLQQQLSQDGRQRIQRLVQVLTPNLPYRGRMPLRTWVQGVWLNLGGLALCDDQAKADAEAYFDLLQSLQNASGLPDFAQLDEQLQRLYATPGKQADSQVQMMTMHAAKGLEFDIVILPGLGRKPRQDSHELLYWLEKPHTDGQMQLLMAPIRAHQAAHEPIADFIRALNKDKNALETVRLLYVAMTRARRQLHLFAHCEFDKKQQPKPQPGSLLQTLWPVAAGQFDALQPSQPTATSVATPSPAEHRLAADWHCKLPDAPPHPAEEKIEMQKIDFIWAGDTARHVGTLVHRYLERIANEGVANWPLERINQLQPNIQASLANLGVAADALPAATDKITRALHNTLQHEQGCWILQPHTAAVCELALTVRDDKARHYIIDRTFIDDQGTRWIIDYKTGEHLEKDVAAFMDQEQARYHDQLQNYARIFNLLESRRTKLALYFPLLQGWRQWDYVAPVAENSLNPT